MRITCPGCGSVFDVPDRAVPDPGRDMQCAGCGTSWYLLKGGGPLSDGYSGPPRPVNRQVAGGGGGTAPAGRSPAPEPDAAERVPPPQRRVPPEVLAILRAEAETERRARQRAATGAVPGSGVDDGAPRTPTDSAPGGTVPDARPSPPPGPFDARPGGEAGFAQDRAARPRPDAGTSADGAGLDARGRLARLTAAERRPSAMSEGSGIAAPMGTRDGDEDHGLVEDADAALRAPRLPLLGAHQAGPVSVPAMTAQAHLPVQVAPDARRALVVLQARRRGFRLGFWATMGVCCGALALYLVALNAGDMDGGAVFDAVRSRGAQVQAALVDWLRRVVVPALS